MAVVAVFTCLISPALTPARAVFQAGLSSGTDLTLYQLSLRKQKQQLETNSGHIFSLEQCGSSVVSFLKGPRPSSTGLRP